MHFDVGFKFIFIMFIEFPNLSKQYRKRNHFHASNGSVLVSTYLC